MRYLTALSLIPLVLPPAVGHAFCGTFVGQAGAGLYNNTSQVVIAREGKQTALTLAFDYEGDLANFALVLPVPEVLTAEDVSEVDYAVIKKADTYSGPRLVEYSCEDFAYQGSYGHGCGCIGVADDGSVLAAGDGEATTVEVEESFTVGQYDIVILSAEESSDLFNWLTANGYAIPEGGDDLLQEYIDSGSFFMAARITLDELEDGPGILSPLQLRYESEAFMLPVRIGTLSANGDQDLLIYTLTDETDGEVNISNYAKAELEHECMWKADGNKFGDFYSSEVDDATAPGGDGPHYLVEYSWSNGSCDPCSGDPLGEADLRALGWRGAASSVHFTRLHLRYGPDEITQDLNLYTTGMARWNQVRYITYKYELESMFPVCGAGWADEPGTCDDVDTAGIATSRRSSGGGAGTLGAIALMVMMVLARRELA